MTNSENHDVYRSPTPGMLQAAALVQDWSIFVLDALQSLHLERCSSERPLCPIDRYDYSSAIEAAGQHIRDQIEWYAERWVDAPELAARTDPRDVALAIFVDLDEWIQLSEERFTANLANRERLRHRLAIENRRAREHWRATQAGTQRP